MLVLSRKRGESLLIGDSIKIEIGRISGNQVRVCIEAPDGVRIVRAELLAPITNGTESDQLKQAEARAIRLIQPDSLPEGPCSL